MSKLYLMDREVATVYTDGKQYTVNLHNGEGNFHLSLNTPQHILTDAVLDYNTKSEVQQICYKYNMRDHSGNFRNPRNSTKLVWGRNKDGTFIMFAQSVKGDIDLIMEMVKDKFPILQEEYAPKNYDDVYSILVPVKRFLREECGVRVRIPNTEEVYDVQTTFDDIDDRLLMQQTIDNLIEENSNLGKELDELKYIRKYVHLLSPTNIAILTVVIPAIQRNRCPYCGSPLVITKLGRNKKGAGEIRIGCSGYKKHKKGKYEKDGNSCHFYACVPDWVYVLLMDHIDNALLENEWLDNPDFVTSRHIKLLDEFKEFRDNVFKEHQLNGFDFKRYRQWH